MSKVETIGKTELDFELKGTNAKKETSIRAVTASPEHLKYPTIPSHWEPPETRNYADVDSNYCDLELSKDRVHQLRKDSDFCEVNEIFVDGDHPLANYLVLEIIFGYLKASDLKVCRLVNTQWKTIATPHMLSQGLISVDADDEKELRELENWRKSLKTVNQFDKNPSTSKYNKFKDYTPFKNFVFNKITHQSYPNIGAIMGLHVESVIVSHWWNDSRDLLLEDYEDLILNQCPNLKQLNIPATENFNRASKFFMYDYPEKVLKLENLTVSGDGKPAAGFWRIINLSPNLKSLKVDCQLVEEFWKPDPIKKIWNERMDNLEKLECKSYGNESISNLSSNFWRRREWSLKYWNYECYVLTNDEIRACSNHVAKTVEEFRIVLFNKRYDPWPTDKGKEWIIPPTKLKHFKLEIDDHCEGQWKIWRCAIGKT